MTDGYDDRIYRASIASRGETIFVIRPVGVQSIAVSMSVCLSVCLRVCLFAHISQNHSTKFHEMFFVHVTGDRASVVL